MKKGIISKTLALGLALSAIGGSIGVSALQVDETTNLDLSVKAGVIVNPEAPEPEGNNGGPGNGTNSFQFWLWPKDISFNELKVSNANQEVGAKLSLDRYLAVGDLRGNGDGYKVTASISELKDATDTHKIVGAKVNWSQEGVKFTKPETDYTNVKDTTELTMSEDISVGTSETTLFKAEKDKGLGFFGVKILPATLKLFVPGNQGKAGVNYTSTITWSLNDTPE